MNTVYDVIIIGAGISGMIAAHTILEKEPTLDIIILEAKDRIGGRTLSLPVKVKNNNTCLFDFGGHWVSSSQTHLQKYINLLNLHLVPQHKGLGIAVSKKGSFEPFHELPIVGNVLTSYEIKWFFAWLEENSSLFQFESIQNSFTGEFYDCVTMENYINSKMYTTAAKNVAKNIVRITTGVEASQISVLLYLLICNSTLGFTNQYMNEDGGSREYWIQEGAQEICNRLQNLIGKEHIKFQQPVTEINHSRSDFIKVLTSTGTKYNCTRIICTIPAEQIPKIKFEPPMSRQRISVLQAAQVGHMTKFVITFDRPFWRLQGYSGEIFACEDGPISYCYDASKNDNPALVGYIRKPNNIQLGQDGTFRESVIRQLVKYLGKDAEEYIDYKEVSWSNESYVGGCPRTCAGIQTMKWYYLLCQPLGSIEWAGAETASEWNGFMNGAVQSGYRAAINILYDTRPQCINYHDFVFLDTRRKSKIRITNTKFINKYTVMTGLVVSYIVYKLFIKKLLLNVEVSYP